jgi:hypothetical protein
MHEQAKNQVMQLVRAPCVKRGERQHDKGHEFFNRGAKDQTAHQWVSFKKLSLRLAA